MHDKRRQRQWAGTDSDAVGKQTKQGKPTKKAKQEPAFKNSPFAAQKAALGRLIPPPPVSKKTEPPTKPAPTKPEPVDDQRLFYDEMAMVKQLAPDPRGHVGVVAQAPRPANWRRHDEAEAYAQLADLVDGVGAFEINETDEYVEGLAPGMDRRLLRKLKRGDYAMQGHLDLHGYVAEDAQDEVAKFLLAARTDGRRCVLLVHGRGYHSKDGIPVLKEKLKAWLTRGRLAGHVLAFCSARPSDGGAGAMYVLLRR